MLEVTTAITPKNTTPPTFRSISGFVLPSMHHSNTLLFWFPMFAMLETSATALCGTNGTYWYIVTHIVSYCQLLEGWVLWKQGLVLCSVPLVCRFKERWQVWHAWPVLIPVAGRFCANGIWESGPVITRHSLLFNGRTVLQIPPSQNYMGCLQTLNGVLFRPHAFPWHACWS